MSKKGNCWNNAVTERFFLDLKMERVWRKEYANHAEATQDIADSSSISATPGGAIRRWAIWPPTGLNANTRECQDFCV